MNVLPAAKLAQMDFDLIRLSKLFSDLLGEIELKAYILMWGIQGSGKSTLSMDLANDLARFGKVLYVAAEEGHGATIAQRIERLGAKHTNLLVAEYESLEAVKRYSLANSISVIVLDSISQIKPGTKATEAFTKWAKGQGIGVVLIAHALKTTKGYKGTSDVGHASDVVVEVYDGKARTTKNRYAQLSEIPVTFSRQSQGRSQPRDNPVPVPFKTTLRDVVKRFNIRGVKRLNSLVGFNYGCAVQMHSGESYDSKLSFRYKRINKKSNLELLVDGKVQAITCEDSFVEALAAMVRKQRYGDMTITISKQDHAKKILGAREYRRQEKEHEAKGKPAPRPKAQPKKPAPKPKAKAKPKAQPKKPAPKKDKTFYPPDDWEKSLMKARLYARHLQGEGKLSRDIPPDTWRDTEKLVALVKSKIGAKKTAPKQPTARKPAAPKRTPARTKPRTKTATRKPLETVNLSTKGKPRKSWSRRSLDETVLGAWGIAQSDKRKQYVIKTPSGYRVEVHIPDGYTLPYVTVHPDGKAEMFDTKLSDSPSPTTKKAPGKKANTVRKQKTGAADAPSSLDAFDKGLNKLESLLSKAIA